MPDAQDRRRIRPIRVLLADDHPLYAETLELVLGSDHRIEIAGRAVDGVEAVELAAELRPDVVVMDVHMPRRDGIEAAQIIRASFPRIAVVMLSSSSAVEDLERAHDAGACSYLSKDVDGPTIAEEVLRVGAARLLPSARRAA